MPLTPTQILFHLDAGKQVVVEQNTCIMFFQENSDEEDQELKEKYPYLGVLQEKYGMPHYYGFTKENLQKLLNENPEMLENAEIGEVMEIDLRENWYIRFRIKLNQLFNKIFRRDRDGR